MLDDAPTDDGGPPPPAANASTPTATLASTPSTLTTSPALNSGETDSEGVVFAPLRKIWDCIMERGLTWAVTRRRSKQYYW